MRSKTLVLTLLIVALLVTGCAAAAPAAAVVEEPAAQVVETVPAAEQVSAPVVVLAEDIPTDYDDAANIRSQLAYGILKLDGTANAVTADQAAALLPLWQAVLLFSSDTTTASAELTAVQDQIAQTLTPEQFQAILTMRITNTELNTYYGELGIVVSTPEPGMVPGSKKNMSEEDRQATRAAAQASGVETGRGQASRTALIDKVIEYLQSR